MRVDRGHVDDHSKGTYSQDRGLGPRMMQLDRRSWSQFLALARPYWVCERKWTPWGLAALLIALLLTYTHFSVVFNDLLGDFASALADRDGDRFWAGMRLFLVLLILA